MSSRGNRQSFGGTNSLSYAAGKFKSKENEFKDAITKYSSPALLFAESMKISGEYEKAIVGAKVEDDDATRKFLTEQRNRLKDLCVKSVISSRYAQSFGLTVVDVNTEIQNLYSRTQNTQENQISEENTMNYEQYINNKMQEHLTNQERNSSTVDDERVVRNCHEILGEKVSKKKSRQSSADDEDDDELEVVDSSNEATLKCPFTQQFMTKPMKNKICNHVYEEAAIRDHIRKASGKAVCPIPGCGNRKVSLDQLEEDPIMAMRVKRHLKREETAKKQRIENSLKTDDGDDEIQGGGTTIIE